MAETNPLEGLTPLDREVVEMLSMAIGVNFPHVNKSRAVERARRFCDAVWSDPEQFGQTCLQNLATDVHHRNRLLVSQTTRKVCGEVLEYARTGHVNSPNDNPDSVRNGTLP